MSVATAGLISNEAKIPLNDSNQRPAGSLPKQNQLIKPAGRLLLV
jgi:hypothetical protein